MNVSRQSFFSSRVILGILAGVVASILFIQIMRNYVLATVLGMLAAVIVSRLTRPVELAGLGFITGALAGLYLGARNTLSGDELAAAGDYLSLALYMLGWLLFTGLVCGVYGFITGKFLALYKQGRGPFF